MRAGQTAIRATSMAVTRSTGLIIWQIAIRTYNEASLRANDRKGLSVRTLTVLVLLVLVGLHVSAQEETAPFAITPELSANMDSIEAATVAIRELEPLRAVERRFPTREQVRAYLLDSVAGEDNERIYREASQFYIAFDLLPPGTDLLALYLDFLSQQVGGYYDTETEQMNVVMLVEGFIPTVRLPSTEQITYSHEYTHVLQDQHFDLDALLGETEAQLANPDRAQAVLSLIEGDATTVMNEYTQLLAEADSLRVLAEILVQGAASGTLTLPPGTPPIIEAELLSPYLDGAVFVNRLRREGGWAMVNAAYTDKLPQSTEQILHPDRYLAGDVPAEIMLQSPLELSTGWALLFDRPLGEFYLREYLDTQLSGAEASAASTGWGGDRYHLYYHAERDERAWLLALVWDSEEDQDEFNTAFARFGAARFDVTADTDGCWVSSGEALCFAAESGFAAYAPDRETALALLAHQVNR